MRQRTRRALATKTRFAVFTRDSFRCVYCGARAPDVQLHVDHVKPVALGGTDDIANLATACADCNHGKSDTRLLTVREALEHGTDQELMAAEDRQSRSQLMELLATSYMDGASGTALCLTAGYIEAAYATPDGMQKVIPRWMLQAGVVAFLFDFCEDDAAKVRAVEALLGDKVANLDPVMALLLDDLRETRDHVPMNADGTRP